MHARAWCVVQRGPVKQARLLIETSAVLVRTACLRAQQLYQNVDGVPARGLTAEPSSKTKVRMGLCQIDVGADKDLNIMVAQVAVEEAVAGGAELVSLPECWNSPYATSSFPVYAEPVPSVGGTADPVASPSVAMLVEVAKKNGIYLVGGSVPERDVQPDGTEKIYNTSGKPALNSPRSYCTFGAIWMQ